VGERRSWSPAARRETAERHWHPDIVYEEAPEWPGAQSFRGIEAVLRRFAEYQEFLGEAETEVEEVTDLGSDRVLLVFRYWSVSAGQALPVDHRWAYLFQLEDGLFVHWRAYLDADAAKRDLGLG
jgi:ketosteroid isomerase-like protein